MMLNDDVPQQRPHFAFDDALPALQDGDVLFASGAQLLSSVVKRLTRGVYSHCGFVAHWNGRPMLLHADVSAGVQATLLSSALRRYTRGFDWYAVRDERRGSFDASALLGEAQAHLGLEYNMGEVVHAGAHVLLGAPAPSVPRQPSPTYCSAFVARCFRAAGLALVDAPDNLLSPDQLSRSAELVFRGSIYSSDSVERAPRRGWKAMADAIVTRALSMLPEALREPVGRAREMESLLALGEASIASLGPGLRATYAPLLRSAVADAERARAVAQAKLTAFESGEATEAEVVAAATRWSDDVARALWQKVDEGGDPYAQADELAAAE
jgi:hypothetical protein